MYLSTIRQKVLLSASNDTKSYSQTPASLKPEGLPSCHVSMISEGGPENDGNKNALGDQIGRILTSISGDTE